MATITHTSSEANNRQRRLVEMSWDPITRIVGSLGIYTKIDFENREVAECYSTSSIFRGYSIFMKNKDPRDAHFITSRICGICGDNHATCATYAQNMAFGVRPPDMAEWIVNLGEAAEYMFDHNIFQDNLVGVDFCEQMVKETNPGVWSKAQQTQAPHAELHGYRRISDIMTALNPFTGEFYREALQMSRLTREMFCLMEGRHVHPSTLYPGGVGTVPTVQLFTDYLVRLMKYVEFMKKVVPLHDDLFDFFYQALPGYEKVGQRRILLGCWGSFQDPKVCDYTYKNMNEWGNAMYVTPGVVVDGKLVTTDLVDINLNIRILLGSSYYDDWQQNETFVKTDPLGNPVDQRHPWNQSTIPRPQRREFNDKYSWVMSPRWYHPETKKYLALDTGGGPIARFWATALAGKVDIGYIKATGHSVKIYLPKTAQKPEVEFEWKIPQMEQRHRTRSGSHLLPGLFGCGGIVLCGTRAGRAARRPNAHVDRFQGAAGSDRLRFPRSRAGRAVPSRGHSRREDRQLSSLSADALECESARYLRNTWALRRCRSEHTHLRRKRTGEFPRHRYHARRAQFRSLPALWSTYVSGQRQGVGDASFPYVRESVSLVGANGAH